MQRQARSLRITVPTLFTLLRFACIPFLLAAIYAQSWSVALALFLAAAVTDAIDGALARWLHQQTLLGACLDPLADKSLIISSFIGIAYTVGATFIPWWFIICICIKDLVLVLGSTYIWWNKKLSVEPILLGKLAMVLQSAYGCYLLLKLLLGFSLSFLTTLFFWLMCIVSFMSFAHYLSRFFLWQRV
ncbi:MAG TPA: CDP-alcohol phosphatidyltransferase family protein [Candidatus Babeliaceae bacterium]|nr:CDP-alcohol phosphatidyltransferase family protein [Candidatus Babeliaceae bacterium]